MQGGRVDDEHAVVFRNHGINELTVVTYRRAPEGNTRLDAAQLPPCGRVEDTEFLRCGHSIGTGGTVANIDDCSVRRSRPRERKEKTSLMASSRVSVTSTTLPSPPPEIVISVVEAFAHAAMGVPSNTSRTANFARAKIFSFICDLHSGTRSQMRSMYHQAAGRGNLRHRHFLPRADVGQMRFQPGWQAAAWVDGTYNPMRGFPAMVVNGEVDGRVHFVS